MAFFDGPQAPGPMDPNMYAKQYANSNGISLDEAKAQLKAKFGDPQKPNSTFAPTPQDIPKGAIGPVFVYQTEGPNYNYNANNFKDVDPYEMEKVVEYEAKRNNMSPQEFAQLIGLPPRQKDDDQTVVLKELGIPEDIIKQGDDAIRKYAQDHNIDIPAKE